MDTIVHGDVEVVAERYERMKLEQVLRKLVDLVVVIVSIMISVTLHILSLLPILLCFVFSLYKLVTFWRCRVVDKHHCRRWR
jgi:hypothetical protein